jgi:hypothetical protein
MRTFLKLAVVALLANATWHLFGAYAPYYKFKDAVQYAALHRGRVSDEDLKQQVLDIAAQFDVPVSPAGITVSLQGGTTTVDASYVQGVDLLPGYTYPWPFAVHLDVLSQLR